MTVSDKPVTLTMELDVSRAIAPVPVVVRWILKVLLRRYGVRCRKVEVTDVGTHKRADGAAEVSAAGPAPATKAQNLEFGLTSPTRCGSKEKPQRCSAAAGSPARTG